MRDGEIVERRAPVTASTVPAGRAARAGSPRRGCRCASSRRRHCRRFAPEVAGGAVGAGDRDRDRRDGRGRRRVRLRAGEPDRGDRRARHQPFDGHAGSDVPGRQRGPASHLGADDRPYAERALDAAVYQVPSANVYRNPLVPAAETGGIGVDAAGKDLPHVDGRHDGLRPLPGPGLKPLPGGRTRRPEREHPPDRPRRRARDALSRQHLVHGGGDHEPGDARHLARLRRVHLAAGRRADVRGPAEPVGDLRTRQPERGSPGVEPARRDRRPPTVRRGRRRGPSDALEARAAAKGQFTALLAGLGAVALLVGAIGIANIMVISVLERRGEIGLRRALGATRRHISTQFLTESRCWPCSAGSPG